MIRSKTQTILTAAAASALLAACVCLTCAAAGYPEKPIRIISPSSPGGGADTVARLIGPDQMGTLFKALAILPRFRRWPIHSTPKTKNWLARLPRILRPHRRLRRAK